MNSMSIYLSSSFSAREGGQVDLIPLRIRLQNYARDLGFNLVLAEQDEHVKEAADIGDHPRILEGCARLAGKCDAFFGVVFERHGTRINIGYDKIASETEVSFFEAELLEACMNEKPTIILIMRKNPPGPSMRSFLNLAGPALNSKIESCDEHQIFERLSEFLSAISHTKAYEPPWIFDFLCKNRISSKTITELKTPKLRFLNNSLNNKCMNGVYDDHVFQSALNIADRGEQIDGQKIGQISRLSYTWIALREIVKLPPEERALEAVDRLFSTWNSLAAWYGLHGTHPMGCLAALNEVGLARRVYKTHSQPHGARASAFYSVGTRLRTRSAARRFFRQSHALASAEIKQSRGNSAGLGVRAAANLRLAALGEPWRFWLAIDDFKTNLKIREKSGASDSEIGEALVSYAHALGRTSLFRGWALQRIEDGLKLMKKDNESPARVGFLTRAMRQHADLLLRSNQIEEALATAESAKTLALGAEHFDQVRKIDLLIGEIKKRSETS